jgi:hypothetical protein
LRRTNVTIHHSAWKAKSANFVLTAFLEVRAYGVVGSLLVSRKGKIGHRVSILPFSTMATLAAPRGGR